MLSFLHPQLFSTTTFVVATFVSPHLAPTAFGPSHLKKTFEIGSILNTLKKG